MMCANGMLKSNFAIALFFCEGSFCSGFLEAVWWFVSYYMLRNFLPFMWPCHYSVEMAIIYDT